MTDTAFARDNRIRLMASAFPWRKLVWFGGVLLTAWTVLLALVWARDMRRWFAGKPPPHSTSAEEHGTDNNALTGVIWSPLRWASATGGIEQASVQRDVRYRLAGTFNVEDEAGGSLRRAVLDDLASRAHHIVSPGDVLGDAIVERIEPERVWLRRQDHLEEIALRFQSGRVPEPRTAGGETTLAAGARVPGRFSKQVDEYRWTCDREALLQYYEELFDAPDRLAAVFDSLKPLYDDDRRITGYVLGVEGEKAFFDEVGLRQGDIVRKVNSMPMSSRRRAEYFINEFVRNNLSAFVLEIERDGTPLKLIYEVR